MRATLWAKAVANAMGSPIYLTLPRKEGLDPALYTEQYWRSKLRALAGEIHGASMAPLDHGKVTIWDYYNQHEHADANFRVVLEGFIAFHEAGHYELRHGDIVRAQQGDIPEFLFHVMEHDADAFALGVLLDVVGLDPEIVAPGLCLLFALLALAPSLEKTLPECSDGIDHPHPMRRLSWLLHKVFQGDGEPKSKCLRVAAEIIGLAYREAWGDSTDAMVEEIWGRMLLAPLLSMPDAAPEDS